MITNNGKALCFCKDYSFQIYKDYLTNKEYCDVGCNVKYTLQRTNGIAADIYRNDDGSADPKMNYNYLASGLEIIIGSGDTVAKVTDYQLENEILSPNLKVLFKNSQNKVNASREYDNPLILQAVKTYYNSSLIDSITIKEIGLITKDGFGYSYLLMREVLSQPIVLGPDETITLSVTFN